MASPTFKIDVYDATGSFVTGLPEAAIAPFTTNLNSGQGTMNVPLDLGYDEGHTALQLGYEYRIYSIDDSGGQVVLYSGIVISVKRQPDNDAQVVVSLVGYAGKLAKTQLMGPGDEIAIRRDGTYTTDSTTNGSTGLDTKKASDQIKFIVNMYRARNADVDQSYLTGYDTDVGFGSTTRLTQAFTTANDTEKAKCVGVRMRLKYNSGTRARIDVALRADDGTGKPSATNLSLGRMENLTSTSYNTYNVLWDTPVQLTANTKYHIVVVSSSSGTTSTYHWAADGGSATYSGGDRTVSTDSGGTWTIQTGSDHIFQTLYVDESKVRINYTSTSIDDSADNKAWKYTAMTNRAALDYVVKYAPADWNFYIDETWTVHFHPAGFSSSKILNTADSATGWTNGSNVGSIAADTTNRKEGSGSISFALTAGTSHFIYKDITAVNLSSYQNAGCWLKVPATTILSDVRVRLYSNSGTNYSEWVISPLLLRLGDWNWLTPSIFITRTPNATSGTLDLTAVDRIALVINNVNSAETTTWYMDDWKAGTVQTTSMVKGRDFSDFSYEITMEDLVNRFILSNNATASPIQRIYEDSTSASTYGTFDELRVDGRLIDTTTFDEIGNQFIAKNALPKSIARFTVIDSEFVDKNALRPGYLVNLKGFSDTLNINKYFIITAINWRPDSADLQVEELGTQIGDRVSDVEQRLELLESYSSSTGDATTIAFKG